MLWDTLLYFAYCAGAFVLGPVFIFSARGSFFWYRLYVHMWTRQKNYFAPMLHVSPFYNTWNKVLHYLHGRLDGNIFDLIPSFFFPLPFCFSFSTYVMLGLVCLYTWFTVSKFAIAKWEIIFICPTVPNWLHVSTCLTIIQKYFWMISFQSPY